MRIPPPVLAVSLALLMWLSSMLLSPSWSPNPWASAVALLLAVAGTAIGLNAKLLFRRARTTVNPMRLEASQVLVRMGPYCWSRNPMYIGRALQLLALAVYLASWVGLIGVGLFAIYLDRVQIRAEERALAAQFPQQYPIYRAATRRWL